MGETCNSYGEMRNAYRILVEKSEVKPKCRWRDNTQVGLIKAWYDDVITLSSNGRVNGGILWKRKLTLEFRKSSVVYFLLS
jgi:hypothetical protein